MLATSPSTTDTKRFPVPAIDFVFALILMLALFLYSWQIGNASTTNAYYTQLITTMTKSWHAFWIAGFDPNNVSTGTQPPVALWFMAMSANCFGVHTWSLVLPSIGFGVGSVALIYQLITPIFGRVSGRLAALAMTLTPVVVTNLRTNNLDTTLLFFLLLACLLLEKALTQNHLGWLIGSFAMIGIAFNIKLMQAFLILPIMVMIYWLANTTSWRQKLTHLSLAAVTLIALSVVWPLSIDLTATQTATQTSVLQLAFSTNTNQSLLAQSSYTSNNSTTQPKQLANSTSHPSQATVTSMTSSAINRPDPNRTTATTRSLVQATIGSQGSWLLPFAIFGLFGGLSFFRDTKRKWWQFTDRQQQLLLWTGWLLPVYGLLMINAFQADTLVMLAPAIAALFGITLPVLIRLYHQSTLNNWQYYLLPLAIVTTTSLQAWYVYNYYALLAWLLLAIGATVSMVLISGRQRRALRWFITIGLLTVAITPAWWSLTPALAATNRTTHTTVASSATLDAKLLNYLTINQGAAKYLMATDQTATAAPYMMKTGQPAIALGGYNGTTTTLTLTQFKRLVTSGQVRFYYTTGNTASTAITRWIKANAKKVALSQYQTRPTLAKPNAATATNQVTATTGSHHRPLNKTALYDLSTIHSLPKGGLK